MMTVLYCTVFSDLKPKCIHTVFKFLKLLKGTVSRDKSSIIVKGVYCYSRFKKVHHLVLDI